MSDFVRSHRQQPTRLPCPWDSPGKNTGAGYHFLLQCMKVKSESEVAQLCLTLSDHHGLRPPRLPRPWDFPGKSAGLGCHCLLRISHASNVQNSPSQASTVHEIRNSMVQARLTKGRGTRDQIANICWIIEKAREFQKSISSLLTMPKPLTV